jgi:hypothetical protein
MHPLKIDPKALPVELTETELDALVRMLNLKGHNVKVANIPGNATWGAKLDERHPQLEKDLWYSLDYLLWVRAAALLVTSGYTRADDGPVPVFSKGKTHIRLVRKLGSLVWIRRRATTSI